MKLVTAKKPKEGKTRSGGYQVNLLPPETVQAREVAGSRNILLAIMAGVLVLVVLGGVWSALQVSGAQDEKSAQDSRRASLLAQQAKYGDVPRVLGQVSELSGVLGYVSSQEVPWHDYLDAISAKTPKSVTISTMTVAVESSLAAAPTVLDALQPPSVGRVTLTGVAATDLDGTAWATSLGTIRGLADPRVSESELRDGSSSDEVKVTMTVEILSTAYRAPLTVDPKDGE